MADRSVDLGAVARRRTVLLTTRGRKSGQPRTVKIWFVVADSTSIYVQHASRAPANWYGNLLRDPAVSIDFGDGPRVARAQAITDRNEIAEVLRRIRRKYLLAWVFQLMGMGKTAVAARIVCVEG